MVEDIEHRIKKLEDINEIRDLKALYCRLCDDSANRNWRPDTSDFQTYKLTHEGRADALALLFAEDGVWNGASAVAHRGRDAIRNFFLISASTRQVSIHCAMNPSISVQGDSATGVWHILAPSESPDGGAIWVSGRYEDDFVRTLDGWKFKELRVHLGLRSPYAKGWSEERFD